MTKQTTQINSIQDSCSDEQHTQVNIESYSQKVLESDGACWLVFALAKEKLD